MSCAYVIETMPVHDEADPVEWRIEHYWFHEDRAHYTVCDSDGNHEGIDEDDVPTCKQVRQQWAAYYKHVAATGQDPLDEFFVKDTRVAKERWAFRFSNSILGVVLSAARRGKLNYHGAQSYSRLPPHVCDFLTLAKNTGVIGDFRAEDGKTSSQLAAEAGVRLGRWHETTIEHTINRDPAKVASERKRAARRALRRARPAFC